MSKSINVVFIKQGKKENEGFVYVRTIENSIVKKKSLKIKVSETQWDNFFNQETQRFRNNKSFPKHEEYNDIIIDYLKKLSSVGNDFDLLPDNKKSFLVFWKKYIDTTENHGTKIKHEVVYNKLAKYLKTLHKTDLLFKEITPFFIRELRLYLKQVKDPKGLSNNSVNHYLKVIKSIINHSHEEGHFIYLINPFTSITFNNETKEKRVINEDELKQLQNTIITDVSIDLARKMFLFELFSNGMRISDILTLRWNNIDIIDSYEGRLKYKMFKTDELISIPINLNISLILTDLLGREDRYPNLIRAISLPFIEDGKNIELTLKDIEERILKIAKDEDKPRALFSNNQELVEPLLTQGGYFYTQKNEIEFLKLFDLKKDIFKMIDRAILHGVLHGAKSQKEPNHFIFPILDNKEFENIDSKNDFTKITMKQYKTIKNATIVYDRKLKKVGTACNIKTNLSSHVSRHSFTNLLLNMDNVNLYDISQSLGHKNITITQNYIQSGFNNKKIDYLNKDLDNKHRKKF